MASNKARIIIKKCMGMSSNIHVLLQICLCYYACVGHQGLTHSLDEEND